MHSSYPKPSPTVRFCHLSIEPLCFETGLLKLRVLDREENFASLLEHMTVHLGQSGQVGEHRDDEYEMVVKGEVPSVWQVHGEQASLLDVGQS